MANTSSTVESSNTWCITRNLAVDVERKIPQILDFNRRLDSPFFSLSNANYCIRISIYPNYVGDIYLCLNTKAPLRPFTVLFAIGIRGGRDFVFERFSAIKSFQKETDFWQSSVISKSSLSSRSYSDILNGKLTVFLKICLLDRDPDFLAAEAACQIHSIGSDTLSKDFKELLLGGNDSDVDFHVQDKKFSAHKLVLTTRSTVFRAMLEADMLEKNNGTVKIADADPDIFEQFLLYLYSGELNFVTSSNALGLYLLADKYNLKELRKVCCECLTSEINVDIFCDVAILASLHNETELLETVEDFFNRHAEIILPTPKWLALNAEHMTLANELMIKMVKYLKSMQRK